MRLVLMRHAEVFPTAPNGTDAERTLTPGGRQQAAQAGRAMRADVVPPVRVLHSPKTRAAETARIVAATLGAPEPVIEERLRGGWEPAQMLETLRAEGAGTVVLVGHEPDIGRLLATLLDPAWRGSVPFTTAGFATIEVESLPPHRPGRLVRFGESPGREHRMLDGREAVLVVVDMQAKLLPHIDGGERLVEQVVRLVRGFRLAGVPVLVTEQYRKGLGETDPRVAAAFSAAAPEPPAAAFEPIEKSSLSCFGDGGFRAALTALRRSQVVLCGIEAHVCVLQSALHLLEEGYHVEVVADATSSRSPLNREIALSRLAREGARWTSVEACVFELLAVSGTEPFKSWVKLIR
jgi:phosphohistidine phosphatase SixA